MNEQFAQMVPMWILAGMIAGWLADALRIRRGYGLLVDMAVGVSGAVVGGGLVHAGYVHALYGRPAGMLVAFGVGVIAAACAILGQRICLPYAAERRERRVQRRLLELRGPLSRSAVPEPAGRPADLIRRPAPPRTQALARIATTGIYLLRGIPLELQQAARARALRENTAFLQVLLNGVAEYAAGTWTPRAADHDPVRAAPRPNREAR